MCGPIAHSIHTLENIDDLINVIKNLTVGAVIPFMDNLNDTQILSQSGNLLSQTNQLLDYVLQLFWPSVYVMGVFVILLIISLIVCTGAFLIAVIKYTSAKRRVDSELRNPIILNKWEPKHETNTNVS
uniref:Uncharacterized protein n=1 Tax=Panagrolaimus sp. PS1159 TaxID=55785 RepID=A0AC35G187_9BILA